MVMIPPDLHELESQEFDRWVIAGERFEWRHRVRGRHESVTFTRIMTMIGDWADTMSEPRDVVLTDVGCWLAHDPLTALNPPISVTAAEVVARTSTNNCWIAGVPKLVVEIVGHGQHPEWGRRIDGYLRAGVSMVWLVDPEPVRRRVDVFRPKSMRLVSCQPGGILTCPDLLPGFAAPVADFFR